MKKQDKIKAALRGKDFKKGDRVVYQCPGELPLTGACTSDSEFSRVGIQFDSGAWGYCYTGYVTLEKDYIV